MIYSLLVLRRRLQIKSDIARKGCANSCRARDLNLCEENLSDSDNLLLGLCY